MRQTNTELVTEIMEFSDHGGMAQLVVMEAIGSYVNRIVDDGPEKIKKDWGENYFINPYAWYATCEEIVNKISRRK